MTTFPGSPRLMKGGIVLLDSSTGAVKRVIALQYNPDTLTRTLQPQFTGSEEGDRSEALRLKGPPVETIRLEAEIDATDQMEFPERNPNVALLGIQPQIAALETMIYPESSLLLKNHGMAASGMLEIVPAEASLSLFVWSRSRIVPFRLTSLNITEEAFDTNLNPIRAKISLDMRVLSITDLGFDHKGGDIYMTYQMQKELMASLSRGGVLSAFGIAGVI
jgi:hypothetical protein